MSKRGGGGLDGEGRSDCRAATLGPRSLGKTPCMTSFEYHLLSCLEGRIPTILKKTVFSIGRWDLHLEAIRGSLLAKKLKKLESEVGKVIIEDQVASVRFS